MITLTRGISALVGAGLAAAALAVTGPDAASARTPDRCTEGCVFVLDRGRFKTVELPFADLQDWVRGNNRGDLVGGYVPRTRPTTSSTIAATSAIGAAGSP